MQGRYNVDISTVENGITLTATGTAAEAKDQMETEATEGRLSVNGEYLEWIVEN